MWFFKKINTIFKLYADPRLSLQAVSLQADSPEYLDKYIISKQE